MLLAELKGLLEDYPLNVFVGTPATVSIDQERLSLDMKKTVAGSFKAYLRSLSELIACRGAFVSNDVATFRGYLSKLIETVSALRGTVQVCEDMTKIFVDEINWARALAIRGMITILDRINQELTIIRNQIKGSRFISRARDRTYFTIWEKVPQVFNILSIMVAIELGQCSSSEIVGVIGKGVIMSETS